MEKNIQRNNIRWKYRLRKKNHAESKSDGKNLGKKIIFSEHTIKYPELQLRAFHPNIIFRSLRYIIPCYTTQYTMVFIHIIFFIDHKP